MTQVQHNVLHNVTLGSGVGDDTAHEHVPTELVVRDDLATTKVLDTEAQEAVPEVQN